MADEPSSCDPPLVTSRPWKSATVFYRSGSFRFLIRCRPDLAVAERPTGLGPFRLQQYLHLRFDVGLGW